MKKTGFSIIEIMVIVTIMAIMVVIAIPSYNKWRKQYSIETDTKDIYGIVQEKRAKAFSQKIKVIISVTGKNMNIVEKDGITGTLIDNITYNLKNVFLGGPISIDTRGTLSGSSIYHNSKLEGLSPQYDCITVDDVRVALGKWDGSKCKAE